MSQYPIVMPTARETPSQQSVPVAKVSVQVQMPLQQPDPPPYVQQQPYPIIAIPPYINQMLFDLQQQTYQLRAELYAKRIDETFVAPDYLVPDASGNGMLLMSSSQRKIMQATSFTIKKVTVMVFPTRVGKENYYLIEVSVCGITRKLLMSETEFNTIKLFENILTNAGCVVYSAKNVADKKRLLTLVQNFIIEKVSDSFVIPSTAGWTLEDDNYTYEDFALDEPFPDNFGIISKLLAKTATPNADNIEKLYSAFKDKRIFEALVCWLIYSLVENFIHPTLRLKKALLLEGDLNICRDIAFSMLKIFNRSTESYNLSILGEMDDFTNVFLQAKDETVIIFDTEKSDIRYLKERLNKRFRYLEEVFCFDGNIKGSYKAASTLTIISNNAIDEFEPKNILKVHIDSEVVDIETLASCKFESDPFCDLITIITDYLSITCRDISKELQKRYLDNINNSELNYDFCTPDNRKVHVVFEYMMKLFNEALNNVGKRYDTEIKSTVKHILSGTEKKTDNDVDNEDVVFLFKDALKKFLCSYDCNIVEINSTDIVSRMRQDIYYDTSNFYLSKGVYEQYIYPSIQKNISARTILKVMKETGYLVTGKEPNEYTTKHTINNTRGRYLCFKRSLIDAIGEISYFN